MINRNEQNERRGSCGMNNCGRRTGGSCKKILNRLRAVDFAITETTLYLDAYPTCREAMALYKDLVAERRQLVETYESQCGPLTMYGNVSGSWDWTDGPMPWEADAN